MSETKHLGAADADAPHTLSHVDLLQFFSLKQKPSCLIIEGIARANEFSNYVAKQEKKVAALVDHLARYHGRRRVKSHLEFVEDRVDFVVVLSSRRAPELREREKAILTLS